MNSYAFVAFFACLAVANAGYYGPSAKIIQGPSSRTTLVGPEGSVISAVAPGGQIVHEEHPGYIAHSAPVATYAAHAAPLVAPAHVAYAAPVSLGHETHISKYGTHITHGAPALYSAHAAPVAAYSAPLAYGYGAHSPVVAHGVSHHGGADALIAGPSGTIATGHSLVAPYHANGVYGGQHHGLYDGHHGWNL